MCKKYKIEVISKYGVYNKEADTYNEIMEQYKETKELFKDVPCDIKVISTENILFTKKGDTDTFEKLYNNLKEDLRLLADYTVYSRTMEDVYNKKLNDKYHEIENKDINCQDDEDKIQILEDLKIILTKRRLFKTESREVCLFYDELSNILVNLHEYERTKKEKETKSYHEISMKTNYYKSTSGEIRQKLNNKLNELNLDDIRMVKQIRKSVEYKNN